MKRNYLKPELINELLLKYDVMTASGEEIPDDVPEDANMSIFGLL